MYFLYTKAGNGHVYMRAYKRKASAMAEAKAFSPGATWRLRDDTGWCDGSENSWKELPSDSADSFAGFFVN
jgi:hypothetical protein